MDHFIGIFIHLVAVITDDEGPPQNKKGHPQHEKGYDDQSCGGQKALKINGVPFQRVQSSTSNL